MKNLSDLFYFFIENTTLDDEKLNRFKEKTLTNHTFHLFNTLNHKNVLAQQIQITKKLRINYSKIQNNSSRPSTHWGHRQGVLCALTTRLSSSPSVNPVSIFIVFGIFRSWICNFQSLGPGPSQEELDLINYSQFSRHIHRNSIRIESAWSRGSFRYFHDFRKRRIVSMDEKFI